MQNNLPFRGPVPSAHGGQAAAIRNRWQRPGILVGGINQTSYTNKGKRLYACRNIVPSRHHVIGSQSANESLI